MGILELVYLVLLNCLVMLGFAYISAYEKAPDSEKFQVLAVGLGMCIGIILRMSGYFS